MQDANAILREARKRRRARRVASILVLILGGAGKPKKPASKPTDLRPLHGAAFAWAGRKLQTHRREIT